MSHDSVRSRQDEPQAAADLGLSNAYPRNRLLRPNFDHIGFFRASFRLRFLRLQERTQVIPHLCPRSVQP